MLRTVAASSGCTTAGSSNSRLNKRVSSANPNSPPWPTTTPVRKDLNQLDGRGLRGDGDHRHLEQQHADEDRRHQWKMPQQQPDIEQHADGDEEQAEQHIAVGTDRRLDLMAKLGFREHHAGEKGAERERQAHGVGRPGRCQHGKQYGERKQLRRAHRGDDQEQRPQQPASGRKNQQQRQNGDADGADDVPGVGGLSAAREHRYQGEKQRKAQVLKQTDRHGQASVRAVVLRLFGQLRNDDGGRRHGHGAADHHGHRRYDIEEEDRARSHDTGGDQYLCAADTEYFPAHGDQSRQGKFQSQSEHQEYHAEIRQQLGGLVVGRESERVRAEQHTHGQISQNRR